MTDREQFREAAVNAIPADPHEGDIYRFVCPVCKAMAAVKWVGGEPHAICYGCNNVLG